MRTKDALTSRLLILATALVSLLIFAACNPSSQGRSEGKLRSVLEKNPADADVRIELAKLLHEKGSHFDAVVVLEEGTKLDADNPAFLRLLGEIYADWAGQLNSTKKYEIAVKYWDQFLDMGNANAETYVALGHALDGSGQHKRAADCFSIALKMDPQNARIRADFGYSLKESGKYEKALPVLLQAAEELPEDYRIRLWVGDAQRLLGDYEASVASMRRARDLCPRDQRAGLDDYVTFTESLLRKGKSGLAFDHHCKFGDRHVELGRPDRALAEYEAALEVLPGRAYKQAGWCYLWIAKFYDHVRDRDKSIEYAERALEAYTKANSSKDLGFVYQHIAFDYKALAREQPQQEIEFLKKALKAHEMQEQYATEAGFMHMAQHALADKARVMAEVYGLEDERVKECRREMARYIPRSGSTDNCAIASIIASEADLRCDEKDYEGAKRLYRMVVPYYGQSNQVESMGKGPAIYYRLACMSYEQDNMDEAMMHGEKCVERLSEIRSMLGVDKFKRTVSGVSWGVAFSGLVAGALTKGEKARALDYSEQYKGRVLLDLLGSKGAEGRQNTLKRKQREKQVLLARVRESEKRVEQASSGRDSGGVGSLQRTLSIEKTKYERLAEDLRVAELEIRNFEDVESMSTGQLQPIVDELTVVSYVVGSQWGTSALILSKEGVEGLAIEGGGKTKLRRLVEAFRREIGVKSAVSRDLTIEVEEKEEAAEKPEKAASEQLYEVLIEPVLPYIKTKLVYISPDSVLNHLPFEALQKDGRYLIEDYSIAYAPSGSVLKICMDRNRNRRESVLALGNPNLKNPAFRLVHAENEVNSLEGLFPQVDVYTDDDATESVVQEHGSEYDILHFACHGELNLDEPMLTSLRLAPDDANDGYLHAGEVFEHDLSASLVVLSACNSALGELTSGNELMGLTRSFLYAGVPSIVASLWTVDDRSTSYLMQHFYKNLATMNKADALREAKLETMKKYPGPFHWAAFCLQGDYR